MLRIMTNPGYPGRPQAAKLGLKAGLRVVLHDGPQGWALTSPPDGLDGPGPNGEADVIVAFFTEAAEIARQIDDLGRRIYPAGGLWIAWPRRAAGHRSDITDNVIREIVLPLGLVDVKVAAIDEDWSGLRVVWRTENRRLGAGSGELNDLSAFAANSRHRLAIKLCASIQLPRIPVYEKTRGTGLDILQGESRRAPGSAGCTCRRGPSPTPP
jgi:hypothetical protein